jgi:acyl-CoA reductase-like NAD-dependent aldehyde dehydrogenase
MAVDETDVVRVHSVQSRFYSADNEVLLQPMLTTLADLDFAYEQERERVSKSTQDAHLRARMLEKLREHHRERREPYLRHLSELHERIVPQVAGPVSMTHWQR